MSSRLCMKYWLFKTEPNAYSIDDLKNEPNQDGYYRVAVNIFDRTLKYGGQKYTCFAGCLNNYLYVSVNEIARLMRKRRVLPGRKYRNGSF